MNPDSSAPTYEHADRIRAMGWFAEVACCFWKEEPNMREVFEMVESSTIYIVPNFISEGYFCQEVLPRELRLDGPVTQRDGRTLYYCDPVGVHPNMKRLLLQRAAETAPGVPPEKTTLMIVGHGTSLNENSTKAIQDQVQLIREGGHGFAEVLDAYMEEAPFVADWHQLASAPHVVVVPFFIADGLHSYQDIPVLLGIMQETGAALSEGGGFGENPHHLRDRLLYYSGAIGTESLMAEVILDQVDQFDERHAVQSASSQQAAPSAIETALHEWLQDEVGHLGEVVVRRIEEGYQIHHELDDAEVNELEVWSRACDARKIARETVEGKFRPLHSAPTLRRGWRLDLRSIAELREALDYLYPGAVALAQKHRFDSLRATPLRDYLSRQTGMYRFANGIDDSQSFEMVAKICGNGKCLRRICWSLTETQPLSAPADGKTAADAGFSVAGGRANSLPLLCIEPCPFIVGAARKIARENFETQQKAG